MKKYIPKIFLVIFSLPTLGQELNLFQETEREIENTNTQKSSARTDNQSVVPVFTLVGVSRFGSEYFATLKHQDEKIVQIEWSEGKVIPIREYNNFSIADVGSRSVSIRFPDSIPCIESSDKSVSCNGNMAVLRLSNKAPIENQVKETNQVTKVSKSGIQLIENTEQRETPLIRNPFSGEIQEVPQLTAEQRVEREARRQRRAEQFRNFEIVRIPDDEVPEGMQRVRTPFGDSLEPIGD